MQLKDHSGIEVCINNIIADYKRSIAEGEKKIVYPGERVLKDRERNLRDGVPVLKEVWSEIENLL